MLPVSIIIPSRGRPRHLRRCIFSLFQQHGPLFELVVVADPDSLSALDELPFEAKIKRIPFDVPHLTRARNLGIRNAGGEVLAFIDDDAAAEPFWLRALCHPILQGGAAATTGPVIGRNGFSFQTFGETVDARAVVRPGRNRRAGEAVKLIGTNMAIRRSAMQRVGAFDESLAYYLDDTEMSWRLREEDVRFAESAVVHHRSAASERRSDSRCPIRLFDVGRSLALYLRRHSSDLETAIGEHREDQRRRLLGHVVRGSAEPRTVRSLLEDFEAGVAEGKQADLSDFPEPGQGQEYEPWNRSVRDALPLTTVHRIHESKARQKLSNEAANGATVSILSLTHSTIRHRLKYCDDGIWVQRGGVMGRSRRDKPWTPRLRIADREVLETIRLSAAGLCAN